MQIVSWNAQQKFREKIRYFPTDAIDVLVVQECENTEKAAEAYRDAGWKYVWIGENIHKGLGVFVPLASTIVKLDWNIDGISYFLPVQINHEIEIVGVWAMGGKSKSTSYAGQISRFIEKHSNKINPESTLLIGDFNSNSIWDKRHKIANHTSNDKQLNSIGLSSLYHAYEGADNGNERHATFYLYRNPEKPYHLDYAYLPEGIVNRSSIEVGKPNKWLERSDHMPLFINAATKNTPVNRPPTSLDAR